MSASNAYVGARKEIALTAETVRGTAESHSAGDWQRHMGFDFGPKVEAIIDESGRGRIEKNSGSTIIREWSEGAIPLYLTLQNAVLINEMIFGQAGTGSGTSGSPLVYSMLNSNQHLSTTVTVRDPVKGMLKYALGMLDSAEFNFVENEYAKVTVNVKAGKEAAGTGTPAYSTTDHIFKPSEITVKFAANYAGLGAAEAVRMQNINLTVPKNAEFKYTLGSTEPYDILNQQVEANGSFTTLYESDTYRTLALARTARAIRIAATSGSYSVTFDLPQVSLENWNDDESLDAYMNQSFDFVGEYENSNGLIKASIVNS